MKKEKTISPKVHREPESLPTGGKGFLAELRRIERGAEGSPPIGSSTSLRQEPVRIGQDPFLAFPAQDLQRLLDRGDGKPELRTPIIGFFGGHGALPLDMTAEAYRWVQNGDMAFVRFTDIFATRFQQLFYRVWSDARALSQFDHDSGNRFDDYVGAMLGIGTPAFQDRDGIPDLAKISLAPLAMGRVKSPCKLQQMLTRDLEIEVAVEEHVPVWIEFEPDNRNALGAVGSSLGRDAYLGARVQSVDEKIVLHIHTESLRQYRAFLPGGVGHARLYDLVYWYLGEEYEVDVALTLPAGAAQLARIGKTAELGWMALLPDTTPMPAEARMRAANYALGRAA